MPKPIDWTPLIPTVLLQLGAMTSEVVDRGALEKLFHIERRTAIRLMHRFGGYQLGKTFVLDRQKLIAALGEFGSAAKGARTPSQIRREHGAAAEFTFPDVRTPERRRAADLPAAIRLEAGFFSVENAGLEDLCAQLWVFLETCKDDRAAVEARLEGTPPEGTA
jgi:hypothetical protein